ncbi:MAG: hypothetical protein WDW38_007951 [Sanguina aurantia]
MLAQFVEEAQLTNQTLRFHPCKLRPFMWHFNGFELDVVRYREGVINVVDRDGIHKEEIVEESPVNNEEDVRFEGHMAYNCSIRCGSSLSGLALTTGLLQALPVVVPESAAVLSAQALDADAHLDQTARAATATKRKPWWMRIFP